MFPAPDRPAASISPPGLQDTPSASTTGTATLTPSNTASSSASLSAGSTPSQTPTPALTPSPTRAANRFVAGNALVVRVGDATYSATAAGNGTALPVYLDEYDPTRPGAAPVSTTTLLGVECSLSKGRGVTTAPFMWWDTEGEEPDRSREVMRAGAAPAVGLQSHAEAAIPPP